ncbi:MAG: von Willebrand factor type A domain-containing protein [Chitinophagaceae bacterium]
MFSQFYLRGEIKDEANKPLSNVKMLLHSTGYIYYSGSSGGFGIMSGKMADSVSISLDGFQTITVQLLNNKYEYIVLKMLASVSLKKKRLVSFTKDMKTDEKMEWSLGGETYSNLLENAFIRTKKFSEIGFAISIDKASYSNVRRFINMGSTVPPDAVRIEEMLNYFNFGYDKPRKDQAFSFDSRVTSCPWNQNNQLLFLKVCARQVNMELVAPSNLVFLIDISGSMDMPNRLPLLKSAFKLMVNNLRDKDTISIVVYGSTVGVWMQPTSGKEKLKIIKAIEDLFPGGATAGASGIVTAYALAKNTFIKGGNNRVILATDGDFNVGQTSEDELEKMIFQQRQSGIYLTCLGVGMGNYKDSKLEVLAKKGNGNFAYLDDEKEAEKVMVKELTQTLYSVADDAYLNIKFNAKFVEQYRLIGFDNKINAVADSSSELEGGEVGSGHTLLAVVEITPTNSLVNVTDNLNDKEELAKITLNYKDPDDSLRHTAIHSCAVDFIEFQEMDKNYQFASSVIMFASLLKKSKYYKNISWKDTIILANQCYNPSDPLQKEFIDLLEKAKKIYGKERRKKKV